MTSIFLINAFHLHNRYFKLVPAARLLACAEAVFASASSSEAASEPGTQGQEGKGGKVGETGAEA